MNILKERDYFEVKLNSLIADYDREVLINLYQPIIGHTACMIYFTLWCEANNQKVTSMSSHGQLFEKMKIKAKDFVEARQALEGFGLLKTYITKNKDANIYSYVVYAPHTPKKFFDNALFYGMLIKNIGETEADRIRNIYSLSNNDDLGDDITTSFKDAFSPDFSDPVFSIALKSKERALGRNSGNIDSEFSFERFIDALGEISQITSDSLSSREMKEIERIATLNGIDEKVAAEYVAKIYDPKCSKGSRIDIKELSKFFKEEQLFISNYHSPIPNKKNYVYENTNLGRKINLMETCSPRKFLAILQGETEPSMPDVYLINDISDKYRLPNPVINVLVDYVLSINNNVLSRNLTEKIAGSLKRQNVKTAIDAMNYLTEVNNRRKKKTAEVDVPTVENKDEEEVDMSWDDILKEID